MFVFTLRTLLRVRLSLSERDLLKEKSFLMVVRSGTRADPALRLRRIRGPAPPNTNRAETPASAVIKMVPASSGQ